jgi:hypothetical protein
LLSRANVLLNKPPRRPLNDAVEQQISDQRNLVEWWRKLSHREIRTANYPRDRGVVYVPEAEKETGIPNQKVSKRRKHVDDPEYPDLLRSSSYRKAMLERA